jgi:hypothetical protein
VSAEPGRARHTEGLGTDLAGRQDGAALNATFNDRSASCRGRRQHCIEAIAVHDFGHAPGSAHEQNRPGTPRRCDQGAGSDGDVTVGA